jgi:zinc transport system substrate-binding protein
MDLGKRLILVWMVCLAFVGACRRSEEADAGDERLRVFASIPPLAGFVERVAGEHAEVQSLVGPGQSPHTFEPTSRQVRDVSTAHLLIKVGMPFEKQVVGKVQQAARQLVVIDANAGIEMRRVASAEAHGHDGQEDEHDHDHAPGELDPHTWMSSQLAKAQARNICRALSEAAPAHALDFEANCVRFEEELDALHAELAEKLAPYKGRAFYVFHPAYGYFADEYGLRQVAIQSGGKQPAGRELAELVRQAKAEGTRVIIVQPQFDKRNAETIAQEIGATVAIVDPQARDYVAMQRGLADAIVRGIGTAPSDGRASTSAGGETDGPS